MLMALGLAGFTACNEEEEYSISNKPIVQTVTTGNAEVSAVSANVAGTVTSLKGLAAQSYTVGVCYMEGEGTPNIANMTATGSCVEDAFNIALSGLKSNTTYSYRAFVTLQKTVTYYGETSTFYTVDAKVQTSQPSGIEGNTVVLGGSASGIENVPMAVGTGVKIGIVNDAETIKDSYDFAAGTLTDNDFQATVKGLLPNSTYYYMAYINLGSGYAYGDVVPFTTAEVEYEFVNLGMGLEVATFNVGAAAEDEMGALLSYGDLSGLGLATVSGDIYGGTNDVAKAIGAGRMPTKDEIRNLLNTCKVEMEGAGYRVTGPNGNSVFFPAGNYWTGSAASAEGFASTFEFNTNSANLSAQLTDQLLAVRPVRKAPIALDATLLQTTWYIDLDADGNSVVFDGPMYYYGTNDSWLTVTNEDLASGDSWNWSPDWKGNSWLCPALDYGQMTFTADGKVTVHDISNGVDYEGTYTVDTVNMTLSLEGAKILHLGNFNDIVSNWSTELKIMSLTESGLQIAALRDLSDEGPCLLVTNYCSEAAQLPVWEGVPASLSVSDPNWAPAIWGDRNYKKNADVTGFGTYTAAAKIDGDINGVNVFVLDIYGYTEHFGQQMTDLTVATVDKITIDGNEVPCDNSKIITGDIEGNGNYRIEIFNEYGAGTKDNSPIDVNLMKGSYVEVTFTLASLAAEASVVISDPNWYPSFWGAQGYAGNAVIDGYGTYTASVALDAPLNGVNVFTVDIFNFTKVFGEGAIDNTDALVNSIKIDGKEVACDNSKIIYGDIEGNGRLRIEIYNEFGDTKVNSPIDITQMVGQNVEVNFTIKEKVKGYEVNFMTCDTNWNWKDHKETVKFEEGKQYTFVAADAQTNGMIDCIDIDGFAADYPNAIFRVDAVKIDDQNVAFDGNKFGYGDIEGKGNYRIEFFNTYGKTGETNTDAFGAGIVTEGGNKALTALACNEKIEVTVTLVTLSGLEAELTLCDSGWASSWPDAKQSLALTSLFPLQYTITFEGARADGMIDLVEIKDVMSKFPNLQLSLVSVKCDGVEVPFDASKILTGDLEDKGNYRIELYNTYGASHGNAAFAGETEGGTIPGLACSEKCEVTISLDKLF